MKYCEIKLCKNRAINYDSDEEMYLCRECKELAQVYKNKGGLGTLKYGVKRSFEKHFSSLELD
jgi:hypothetical protein